MRIRNDFIGYLESMQYDWGYRVREYEDDVGILTLKYSPSAVGIYLEKTLLKVTPADSGKALFIDFNEVRNSLAKEAWLLWHERLNRIVFRRRMTWRELLEHAGRNKRAALLFALAMARSGAYGNFKCFTLPPSLSQQKDAVNLPRLDKPGHPDRVYFIQFER